MKLWRRWGWRMDQESSGRCGFWKGPMKAGFCQWRLGFRVCRRRVVFCRGWAARRDAPAIVDGFVVGSGRGSDGGFRRVGGRWRGLGVGGSLPPSKGFWRRLICLWVIASCGCDRGILPKLGRSFGLFFVSFSWFPYFLFDLPPL